MSDNINVEVKRKNPSIPPKNLRELTAQVAEIEQDITNIKQSSGTFENKPNGENIYIGFSYFCTDKQTTESTQNIVNELTNKVAHEENSSEKEDNWSSKSFFLGLYNNDEKNNSLSNDEIIKNIREDIINGNLNTVIENVIEEMERKENKL